LDILSKSPTGDGKTEFRLERAVISASTNRDRNRIGQRHYIEIFSHGALLLALL
jgi:hypothetical protein